MEQAPNMSVETTKVTSLTPEQIDRNEKLLAAKNKMQLALALDILHTKDETRDIFSNIHDESDLMEPNPETEEYVLLVLAQIMDDVRAMVIKHPEVIEHIADETDRPLDEINLTEAKGYLPQHFETMH